MTSVMYDTKWPHSDEALRLRRLLDEPLADALPPRLWAWGIDTDREKGVFEADAKQLAKIIGFDGDSDRLLEAFLACDVITPTGKPNEYRINGWSRNAKLFKERKRLRATRRKKKERVPYAYDPPTKPVQNEPSSSSSSSSSSSNTNTEDPAVVVSLREGEDHPKPKEVRSTRGFPEAAFEAEFAERGLAAGVTVAAFDNVETSIGGKLVRRCGTEGITQGQLLAEWWHPSWRHWHGFDVRALDKHFAKVRAAIDDPKLRPKPPDKGLPPPKRAGPTAEETERRERERQEALAAEKFVDVEEAERRFAEMRRKL